MTLPRATLKDMLWSDRGREQGGASLRQVLSELRRALGPLADCLLANRRQVGLDPARVAVPDAPAEAGAARFLDGIDIRDPAFEAWLAERRAAQGARIAPAPATEMPDGQRRLLMLSDAPADGMERFFAEGFADNVARALTEQITLQVLRDTGTGPAEVDLVLRTRASVDRQMAGLRVLMESGPGGNSLWSGTEFVEMQGAPPLDHLNVLRLIHEASDSVSEALSDTARLGGDEFDASVTARIAVRRMFSMRADDQLEADRLLETAFDLMPRGVFLAWRALLRIMMLVERHSAFTDDAAAEAEAMAARALELEPTNSMVLAAATHAALVLGGDTTAGMEYAQRGLRANRANPFAWDGLAMAALYHGNAKLAHRAQMIGRHISGNTPFLHWFDMGCAMTATTRGALDEALDWARKSAATAPDFHPPLRYLIALYAHSGRMESAIDVVHRLKRLEPDFTVERLVEDEAYPVLDLRRSALLTPRLIAELT
ncbi:hypothetical protein P1J78_00795 [Psychromarinibacter sp. C21-152]|uniref:Transcriptional regulator n=1 Tax=Psychromarinibacter sediminicola TaxID=3033385 RepID=A0AAE3NN08_9RHOB|nr:hypothetical protein [Psychromarinibacter sediminicola]MDF0599256.1 hypothetical protein [Psychromarinibacter sediminicola]